MTAEGNQSEQPVAVAMPSSARIDFILTRMKSNDISRRRIALLTGIRRSRIHSILHSEADKRVPLRMDECQIILHVLNVSEIEAAVAAELIDNSPNADADAVASIALMMSEFFKGLPEELFDMIDHIDGLNHADLRKEHGPVIRKVMLDFMSNRYQEIADRRDFRDSTIDK